MFLRRRLDRTSILLAGCAAFLLGLVAARRVDMLSGWAAAPFAFAALAALRKRTLLTMLCIVLCGLSLGMWRGGAYLQALQPYRDMAMQKVTLTGTANIDAVYGTNGQITFTVRDVQFTYPQQVRAPGLVKVSGFGLNMVYHGDRVSVSGKLYPTRGANQASVSYAELAKLSSHETFVDTLRRKFAAGAQSALPEPLASFALGVLVGQRNTLPADLTQALLMVGLTHIIAVSGYNLTILLEAARRVLGNHSKVLSTAVALVLIFGFLLVAGTSASIVRAAVISVLGLSAWYYGRSVRPLLLILLAAAGTAYANPVYLWADISWYLSFLAFFGILVLAPAVKRLAFGGSELPLVPQILLESLCAEVMTLPLILYIFGQMSLVSMAANVLVAAVIPLAMLLSFVAGLAGMCISSVAGWFAWPAVWLLTYMVDVVNMLSRVPHVFVENRFLSAADMAACYATVAAALVVFWVGARRKLHFSFAAVNKRPTDKLTEIYRE